jgi:hypothetical protein
MLVNATTCDSLADQKDASSKEDEAIWRRLPWA